jgi:hypothetical protein
MEKLSRMRGCFDSIYPSHGIYPVDAGIIDSLMNGAIQVRDGKIEGTEPPREVPAKLYDVEAAKFLY